MNDIIIYIEEIIFKLFGVELPTLRKEWENHVEKIQFKLDCEHGTSLSKEMSNIQYGIEL